MAYTTINKSTDNFRIQNFTQVILANNHSNITW